MGFESDPLLPTKNNDYIKKDPLEGIEMGYSKYGDGNYKWDFIQRLTIFFISYILTCTVICIIRYSVPDPYGLILLLALTIVCYLFDFTLLHLPVSYLLGQYDFFYLLCYHQSVYKYFLPSNYVLNRIASSKSTVTSSHPYYYKTKTDLSK
ncbi:unnamed protein product [Cunninghamella blakesleeana]